MNIVLYLLDNVAEYKNLFRGSMDVFKNLLTDEDFPHPKQIVHSIIQRLVPDKPQPHLLEQSFTSHKTSEIIDLLEMPIRENVGSSPSTSPSIDIFKNLTVKSASASITLTPPSKNNTMSAKAKVAGSVPTISSFGGESPIKDKWTHLDSIFSTNIGLDMEDDKFDFVNSHLK